MTYEKEILPSPCFKGGNQSAKYWVKTTEAGSEQDGLAFKSGPLLPVLSSLRRRGGGKISPRRESLCIFTKKHSNEVLSSYPWQNMSSSLNIIFGFLSVAGLEDDIGTQLSESWSRQTIKHGICEQ